MTLGTSARATSADLESHAQAELPFPHLREALESGDLPCRGGVYRGVGVRQVRVVEGIEQFCPELRIPSFRDVEALRKRM